MRAIGRGIALTVLVGCAALAGTPRAVAETQDEQPIAVPGPESAPAPTEIAAAPARPLAVRDVRVENTDGGRQVVIALTREPESVQNFQLTAPPRLVVDLRGPLGRRGGEQRFAVGDGAVSRVRVAPYEGQLRIVLDLGPKATVGAVRQQGATLVAELSGSAPTPKATAAAPSTPRATDAVLATIVDTTPQPTANPEPEPTPAAASEPEPAAIVAAEPEPTSAPRPRRPEPTVRSRFTEIGTDGPTIEPIAAYVPPAEDSAPSPARLAPARKDTLGPAPETPVYTGQKISLDFKDADIQNVLRVLADVSGLNIIATDDVQGKVTLHLSDVPWDQAFDLVLRTNRLEKTQEGNVVRVSSVKRLTEERDAMKAANDSESQLEALQVKYIRVNYARADEVLVDKVKGVLSERGAVTFDDRTNTIIVRDIDRGIADASHLIRELDVQSPQVLIEANIVEATQDFARGLGIQWGYRYNAGPSTGNPTGMNFPGTVGLGGSGVGTGSAAPPSGTGALPSPVPFLASFPIPDSFGSGFGAGSGSALDLALGSLDGAHSLTARITALENDGKAKVISRPRVITMNNVAATIQSLTIIRVKLPSTGTVISTGGGGASGASTATEKINTGITLVVTPQVSSDGFVLMNIYAKSSLPDFTRAVDGIPSEVSREANSNVLVRNGDTVVLGGIYRHTSDDREDGLPYLSKVPAIGWLFKRTLESKHHEELIVFLTPKVVETGTAALPPAEQLWQERRGG
jgi:type IV pilus secretin PilQ/predicted competence protein